MSNQNHFRLFVLVGIMSFAFTFLHSQSDGRSYFNTVLSAYGSTSSVQSLRNYHLQGTITVIDGEREDTGQVEIYYKKPDRYKKIVSLGTETNNTSVVGDVRYQYHKDAGVVSGRGRMNRREGDRLVRFLDGELCNILAIPPGNLEVTLLDDTVWVDGVELDVVKIWQSRNDSAWIKLLINPGTHLIQRVEMYMVDANRDTYFERWLEFSDYAPRGPIQFPSRIVEYFDGKPTAVIQVEAVEFNISMSENLFKPE